jgi:hypothetical protein
MKSNGYIFGLFKQKEENIEEYTNKTIQSINLKRLKNVGSSIDSVILMPLVDDWLGGFLLKYTNGDTCIYDKTQKFVSYLFISCDKFAVHNYPKVIGRTNNNCTIIMEWKSKYGCNSCLKKESKSYKVYILIFKIQG